MIKNKAELENMHPLPAAYWDPVLKRSRAKRIKLFEQLLETSPEGVCEAFSRNLFVNWAFVSPPGVSLCSSEGTALESIELSLGLGDIQDCFHRYVSDNEFASYFGVH